MAQFALSKSLMSPQRVALRTPSRSMAAAPLIARVSRQGRTARCVTRAAADTVQEFANNQAGGADEAKVLEDVRAIIAEQLGTDLKKVEPDSKFVDLGADSLDTVEIMMALEEKFEIQLDEEGAEKIGTVQEAADLICQQIDETPPPPPPDTEEA